MWSLVNPNLLVEDEEGRLPSAVVGPSWKETYLTSVGVQIYFQLNTELVTDWEAASAPFSYELW